MYDLKLPNPLLHPRVLVLEPPEHVVELIDHPAVVLITVLALSGVPHQLVDPVQLSLHLLDLQLEQILLRLQLQVLPL